MAVLKRAKPRTIPDERLKNYRDTFKSESILLGAVDRHVQLLPNDRDATIIHPSEMARADWCPRDTWHRLVGHPARAESLTLRSSLIFDTGHGIHRKWQTWLGDMGILWGRWRCAVCLEATTAWSDELPGLCPSIIPSIGGERGRHIWQYLEVPLENPALRVGGHADGVVNPTGDESFLLEVKSIGPGTLRMLDILTDDEDDELSAGKFSKISRPAPSHFRQVQTYLRLAQGLRVNDLGPVGRAVIIYEHKADQQVREFVVEYNPRWTDDIFGTAEDIVWAIDRGREVKCPRGGCKSCRRYEDE